MEIKYETDLIPGVDQVITLYDRAGLPRPTHDKNRIQQMFQNSNLVISAWHDDELVGVCRCITDWEWCCYLSDLAVSPDHSKSGIGKRMIEIVREKIGERSMLLLLSVPTAFEYYPKVGFTKENRCFSIDRKK